MLFATGFLAMFTIGGITGVHFAIVPIDWQTTDTYYVVAHMHYVLFGGSFFAINAGIYYWFPKITGRYMNERLGKIHFWLSLLFMNLVFQPMFAQGMEGMLRRMYDGGAGYSLARNPDVVGTLSDTAMGWNLKISHAAWALGLAQIPFIINFFMSMRKGKKVESDNPWGSATLGFVRNPGPREGGGDARRLCGLDLLRDVAEGVGL